MTGSEVMSRSRHTVNVVLAKERDDALGQYPYPDDADARPGASVGCEDALLQGFVL